MKEVQCPRMHPINKCDWTFIYGKVRDVPSQGLMRCASCELIVHQNNLQKSVNYVEGSMHQWSEGYGGNIAAPEADIQRRIDHLKNLKMKKSIKKILDFGCGKGEMISEISKIFVVDGLEPELNARNFCKQAGMNVYSSVNEIIAAGKRYDLITLFHVFEHFYLPFEELSLIRQILQQDGYILIETPNSNDALLTLYDSKPFSNFTFWSHHPMVHSRISLEETLKNAGFKIELSEGHQRYGLANHLYWLSKEAPGGHVEWSNLFERNTEANYAMDISKMDKNDTLWVVASISEYDKSEEV